MINYVVMQKCKMAAYQSNKALKAMKRKIMP